MGKGKGSKGTFKFTHPQTQEEVIVNARGRRHATNLAAIKLGVAPLKLKLSNWKLISGKPRSGRSVKHAEPIPSGSRWY